MNAFHWIAEVYYWCLWYLGFKDGDGELSTADDREKITYMLRRMKNRLGLIWWVMSLTVLFGSWTLMILVSWWWAFLVAFLCWLYVHVLFPYHWSEVE